MNNLLTPTPKVNPKHRDPQHTPHKPHKHNEKRLPDSHRAASYPERLAQLQHREVLAALSNESQSTGENVFFAQNSLGILDLDVVDGGATG